MELPYREAFKNIMITHALSSLSLHSAGFFPLIVRALRLKLIKKFWRRASGEWRITRWVHEVVGANLFNCSCLRVRAAPRHWQAAQPPLYLGDYKKSACAQRPPTRLARISFERPNLFKLLHSHLPGWIAKWREHAPSICVLPHNSQILLRKNFKGSAVVGF